MGAALASSLDDAHDHDLILLILFDQHVVADGSTG